MRYLLILLMLITGLMKVEAAQMTPARTFDVTVENVELVTTDPLTIRVIGIYTNGCELPLVVEQSTMDNVIFVDLKPDMMASGPVCEDSPVPFETEIELLLEDVEKVESPDYHQAVIINNFTFGLYYGENMDEDPVFFPMFASEVLVEEITVTATATGHEARVRGQLPDGCKGQIVVRQHIDAETAQVKFEVLRLLPLAVMCPMMVVVYDETLPVASEFETQNADDETETVALEGVYTISVNGMNVIYDFSADTQISRGDLHRFYAVIETADVLVLESFPPQLRLQVTGYHQDGCQFPTVSEVRVDGKTLYVEIYREVPNNVRCARRVMPYEDTIDLGSFEPGEYTININDGMKIVEVKL